MGRRGGGAITRWALAFIAVGVAYAALPALAAAQGSCPIPKPQHDFKNPRFQRASLEIGGHTYRFTVLLPSDYATSGRSYPVMYLFHGGGGYEESFMGTPEAPGLIQSISESEPVIVVMPDGGVIGGHSDWPDDPGYQWETFHIRHLVPHIDATYRTLADARHRAAVGFSMGGFGAMLYAGRHPGVFGAAATFSGFPDLSPRIQAAVLPFIITLRPLCTASQMPFGGWGDPATNSATWEEHNPTALVERMRGTLLYARSANGIPCDEEDARTLVVKSVPDYTTAIESELRESNRTFHRALLDAGIDHIYREAPCGIHSHRQIDAGLRDWWPIMMRFFGTSATPSARPELRLRVRPRRVASGRRTRFRFTATALEHGVRTPQAQVRIRFAGREARTDTRGRATIIAELRQPGVRRAIASRIGLRPDATGVRVTRRR